MDFLDELPFRWINLYFSDEAILENTSHKRLLLRRPVAYQR